MYVFIGIKHIFLKKKKKDYGLFLGIGFNYLKGTDPL